MSPAALSSLLATLVPLLPATLKVEVSTGIPVLALVAWTSWLWLRRGR